jgi:hypothetical protein
MPSLGEGFGAQATGGGGDLPPGNTHIVRKEACDG